MYFQPGPELPIPLYGASTDVFLDTIYLFGGLHVDSLRYDSYCMTHIEYDVKGEKKGNIYFKTRYNRMVIIRRDDNTSIKISYIKLWIPNDDNWWM